MSFLPEVFLHRFFEPLVGGGELWVGKPLDSEDLRALVAEAHSPDALLLSIDEKRSRMLRELMLTGGGLQTSPDDMRLVAAAHNILFLSHQAAKGLMVRKSRIKRVVAHAYRSLALPAPQTAAEVFSRFTITAGLGELHRTDVDLRFWIGHRKFVGTEPPARLGYWPSLRNVRQTRDVLRWRDTALSDGQLGLIRALYAASPLSDLLSPERKNPEFAWPNLLPYLRSASICRFVCHRYLGKGLNIVGPGMAQAFQSLLKEPEAAPAANGSPAGRKASIRFVAGLIQYLFACATLRDQPAATTLSDNQLLGLGALFVALRSTPELALSTDDLAGPPHVARYANCHGELVEFINRDFVEEWRTSIVTSLEN